MKDKRYIFLLALGILSILTAGILAFKVYKMNQGKPIPPPRQRNINLIQSWMTINYVAKEYKVSPDILISIKGLTIKSGKESIDQIAKNNNKKPQEVIQKIQETIIESKR